MNVLFLTAWYPVENTPHKGVFVQEHAHAIARTGHKVTVLALDISHSSSVWKRCHLRMQEEDGITTHVISLHSRYWKKIYAVYPLLRRIFMKYFNQSGTGIPKPDIIHSNVLYPAGILGNEIAKRLNVPHVITEHWSKANDFLESHFYASKGHSAYRNADALTFVSEFLNKRMKPYIKTGSETYIIPNVIRTDIFTCLPKIYSQTLVFTAVAAWTNPKRPDLFIDALTEIAKADGNVAIELHLFGEGPQLNSFQSRTYPPNFTIYYRGFCTKKEIAVQMQQSTFFLHASGIETFSIVVAEALCTGTPVIASNRGALPELVNETNGVLCDNTAQSWSTGIASAMKKSYNSATIASNIRDRFTPESIGSAFSRLYAEISADSKN